MLPAFHLPGLSHSEALVVEYTWVAMAVALCMVGFAVTAQKKIPSGFANVIETIVEFFERSLEDLAGPRGMTFFPLIITAFFFILVSNYLGLIPGFIAPTGNINTTVAWAIVAFLSYQISGFYAHGVSYLKHFLGPVPLLAPIMFPMEIISQLARPLSLSVRLFANIMAGELIIKVLTGAAALLLPVIWMTWESILTGPFQAFVFSLLTMIYIGGAVASLEEE